MPWQRWPRSASNDLVPRGYGRDRTSPSASSQEAVMSNMLLIESAEYPFTRDCKNLHRKAMKALSGLSLLLSALASLIFARAALLSRRTGLLLARVTRPYWSG